MFFRPQRGRRGPHILLIRDSDEPIRLDESRLAAWAMALGQSRGGPPRRPHRGMLPDVDFSRAEPAPRRPGLIARLFGLLARRAGTAAESAGAALPVAEAKAIGEGALGEAGRKSYVWPVERESDAGKPAAAAGKKNRNRAA